MACMRGGRKAGRLTPSLAVAAFPPIFCLRQHLGYHWQIPHLRTYLNALDNHQSVLDSPVLGHRKPKPITTARVRSTSASSPAWQSALAISPQITVLGTHLDRQHPLGEGSILHGAEDDDTGDIDTCYPYAVPVSTSLQSEPGEVRDKG